MANKGLAQLESSLDIYLRQKAPPLPKNIKDLIVSLAPWLNIVLIILGLPAILAVLGIKAYVSPFAYWTGVRWTGFYSLSLIFLGATLLLRAMALPGLFSKSQGAWKLLYYSILLNLVYSLLNYNLVGGLIGAVIGLYFWFQVKASYK